MSKEKPVRKEGMFIDDYTETHPAFGMIGLSRISSSRGVSLFGSSIKHSNLLSLTIKTAERNVSSSREHFFGRKQLIEVLISGTQLSELLTSMNVGDGVPCTITRVLGDSTPDIEVEEDFKKEAQTLYKEQMDRTFEKSKELLKKATEALKDGTPKKADKEEFLSLLTQLKNEIGANLVYTGEFFDEKMEKVVVQAKGEIESFINNKITSAGIEALGGKTPVHLIGDK